MLLDTPCVMRATTTELIPRVSSCQVVAGQKFRPMSQMEFDQLQDVLAHVKVSTPHTSSTIILQLEDGYWVLDRGID